MDIIDTETFALEPKLSWVNVNMLCRLKTIVFSWDGNIRTIVSSWDGKFGLVFLHLNSVMNLVFSVVAIHKFRDVSIKNINKSECFSLAIVVFGYDSESKSFEIICLEQRHEDILVELTLTLTWLFKAHSSLYNTGSPNVRIEFYKDFLWVTLWLRS